MATVNSTFRWPAAAGTPEELLKRAREAADLAYAPYSRFHVGSALLFADGTIVKGCNVENASYGLSLCAERSAVAVMAARGLRNPLAVAVVGSREDRDDYFTVPCPPCGACRQVLMEFNPNLIVVLASAQGPEILGMQELLPHSFGLEA
ncbi:MAG: cytidine deaminase [Fretibacterium sp.]|nr:cytidine deaminase [Fretibacterium sp.]